MKFKISTIIFDLDGTIADSMNLGLECANQLASKYKYEPIVLNPLIRDLSAKEFLISHLKLGKIKLLLWAREVKRLQAQKNSEVVIFPEMYEVLSQLSNSFKLGILTSNNTDNTLKVLKNNKIKDFFSFIYTNSGAFGKHRTIKKVLKKEYLSKEEVIYVGDEIRDIDSCHKSGIPIIAVTWGANSEKVLKEAGATFYAYNPRNILDIAKLIK